MRFPVGVLLAVILLFSSAHAQESNAAGSSQSLVQCSTRDLAAISGAITASTVQACLTSPEIARTSTSVRGMAWNVQGPDVPTGGTASFTASTISASGCTVGSWTTISELLAAGTGATSYAEITMTSNECRAFVRMVVTAAAIPVTLATFVFPINVYVEHTAFTNTVSGGLTVTDDANGWAVNVAGGITVTLAPGGSIAVTGIPDTQQEIQAVADAILLLQNLNVDLVDDTTNDGALTVDLADDSTADGYLSTPPVDINATFNNSEFSTIFPDEFNVNARFPGGAENPGFDFWAGVVFWLLVLGFFLYQAWWFAAGFAIPGLLDAMFPLQIPDDMSLYLTLCLLGVVLEVAAHKFSFGHWRTRNSRPSGG